MPKEDIAEALRNFDFNMMQFREAAMKKTRLTFTEVFLMKYVKKFGPTKITTLSSILGLTKPTVTHIVNELERREYVRREFGKEDRRTVSVCIDPKGEELFTKFDNLQRVFMDSVGDMDEKSVEMIVSLINRLSNSIGKIIGDAINE